MNIFPENANGFFDGGRKEFAKGHFLSKMMEAVNSSEETHLSPTRESSYLKGEYDGYLSKLLAGDLAGCTLVVKELLRQKTDLKVIYTDLFQRSLYDVGVLWERSKITVSNEHLATALTETLLTLLHPELFRRPRRSKKALVACGAQGSHRVGAKIVTDYFEVLGWDAEFLVAVPTAEALIEKIEEERPDLLAFSLALSFHLPGFEKDLAELRDRLPNLRIIVGGQAFTHIDSERWQEANGVRIVAGLAGLEQYLEEREREEAGWK